MAISYPYDVNLLGDHDPTPPRPSGEAISSNVTEAGSSTSPGHDWAQGAPSIFSTGTTLPPYSSPPPSIIPPVRRLPGFPSQVQYPSPAETRISPIPSNIPLLPLSSYSTQQYDSHPSDPLIPSSGSTTASFPGEEVLRGHPQKYPTGGRGKSRRGLIVVLIIVVVAVAGAIAGGVGGSLATKHSNAATPSTSASSSTSTINTTSTTSTPSSTSTSPSPTGTAGALVKPGQKYTISNNYTSTVMDFNTASGALTGYTPNGGTNQQWVFEDTGNGTYYMKSVAGIAYVSFAGTPAQGRPLVVIDSNQPSWPWVLFQDPVNIGCIKLKHPSLNLTFDLYLGTATPGTPINLWSINPTRAQAWNFEEVS